MAKVASKMEDREILIKITNLKKQKAKLEEELAELNRLQRIAQVEEEIVREIVKDLPEGEITLPEGVKESVDKEGAYEGCVRWTLSNGHYLVFDRESRTKYLPSGRIDSSNFELVCLLDWRANAMTYDELAMVRVRSKCLVPSWEVRWHAVGIVAARYAECWVGRNTTGLSQEENVAMRALALGFQSSIQLEWNAQQERQ